MMLLESNVIVPSPVAEDSATTSVSTRSGPTALLKSFDIAPPSVTDVMTVSTAAATYGETSVTLLLVVIEVSDSGFG